MVEKATSMIVDLFNKKPSDESISCHPEQIAGIDLGQLSVHIIPATLNIYCKVCHFLPDSSIMCLHL
jgi:hypothetical protein